MEFARHRSHATLEPDATSTPDAATHGVLYSRVAWEGHVATIPCRCGPRLVGWSSDPVLRSEGPTVNLSGPLRALNEGVAETPRSRPVTSPTEAATGPTRLAATI